MINILIKHLGPSDCVDYMLFVYTEFMFFVFNKHLK